MTEVKLRSSAKDESVAEESVPTVRPTLCSTDVVPMVTIGYVGGTGVCDGNVQ
jgi:hypothetical protein